MLLYRELAPWYRLIDPPEDHEDETAGYRQEFERSISPRPKTLLELGAGAGHNAFYLKRNLQCTLTDLSVDMLELSRELNPECEHFRGDMRELRLGRTFDAVLAHDAVCYMATRAELLALARTAFVHTRPGGAALFAPDTVRESFCESTHLLTAQDATRAVRGVEWSWDPDPDDDTYAVEYAFLLRDSDGVRAVHDRHVEGLFSIADWREALASAGFEVSMPKRSIDVGEGYTDHVFLGIRPAVLAR